MLFQGHMRPLTHVILVYFLCELRCVDSFTCLILAPNSRQHQHAPYFAQSRSRSQRHDRNVGHSCRETQLQASSLPDIGGMRVGDIRKELESYGVSTSSFLEKKEMVTALEKARAEGKTAVNGAGDSVGNSTSPDSSSNSTSASSTAPTKSRSERLKEAMDKANAMKVGDLKKELAALGVSTTSFFEKSEFVKAYAESMVDGKKKSGADDEPRDPEYRDVVLQKMVRGDPRQLQGTVIDVTSARKR